jgi:pimeloyl-ACP methyl ester carboxylesterase
MSGPAEADFEDFVERAIAFNPRRTRDQLRRSLRGSLRQLANGKWSWKYDRRSFAAPPVDVDELRRRLITAARNVHCPTLVVRGGDSDMFLDEDAASLSELIPNAQWQRIDGAGHTVQGDRPRELADVLTAFLGRLR